MNDEAADSKVLVDSEAADQTTDPVDQPPASDELHGLSNQFSARIEGLRELLEVISPHVAALDQPEGIESTIDRSGLSTDGKAVVKEFFISQPSRGPELDATDNPNQVDTVDAASNPEGAPPGEGIADRVKAFTDTALNEPDGVIKVLRRLTQGFIAPRESLLHGSLLTVAVASFEFLVAGLFSLHLSTYPKQLKDDAQEFSLADLAELGSIEDARRLLIERRVDGFMRQSLEEWSTWSDKHLGEAFDQVCLDFTHLNEVFQRRHIIVHNGGAVSRQYLERVSLSEKERPKLGDNLPVTAAYMQSALDELEVLGHGLIALARSRWTPKEPDEASSDLNTKVFDLLQSRRWILARKLANVGALLGQSNSNLWMITANGWLATKRLGEFDQCRDKVINWDVSALENQFKLARACLLDESDTALEFLTLTIRESDLKLRSVWGWPILDDLRSDPRCLKVFTDAGYAPPGDSRT